MKILLTGKPQFLGNYLVSLLKGHEVKILENILQRKSFKKVPSFDCVFHLPIYEENEDLVSYTQRAIVGTINLCESHPRKVVFASSYSIYDLDSPVAHVKLCTEDILARYAQRLGFELIILRIGPMLGSYKGQKEKYLYSKAVNYFIEEALRQKPLKIKNPNREMRYINVKDVAKTFINVWGRKVKIKDLAEKITLHESIREHIEFIKKHK